MKMTISILLLILGLQMASGQEKAYRFYDIDGSEITRGEYEKRYNRLKNFLLSYENGNYTDNHLISYEREIQLDETTTSDLFDYLSDIADKEVDRDKAVVISYISATNSEIDGNSKWNVLNKGFNDDLIQRRDLTRLFVHSPDLENLEPFQINDINWFADRDQVLEDHFFPTNVPYGGFLILKPDGTVYIRLHEHSKQDISDNIEKFVRKKP